MALLAYDIVLSKLFLYTEWGKNRSRVVLMVNNTIMNK